MNFTDNRQHKTWQLIQMNSRYLSIFICVLTRMYVCFLSKYRNAWMYL